ncbi:hemerythrin domain-containing protein [[Mycobacterium] nativiensis]|uniref:Hemerythrin domain-containing protein n=1 Tax=[Mycobacterium] nativiensis TaxID=2855503 RepID=A0ABU5Y5M7_9MYCO|nr:hemerythrin domain-containing protein [Mycolicibacter sp. MYC340]MEB3034556.1 hemerythrin domain-containing protein [Mycolicibacter sp. MYC340]
MTVLLPGQAAAPVGPADLRMMYAMHFGFRRDLTHFCMAARRTPATDGATWRALLARWDLLSTILHDHHRKEDVVIWPILRERAEADGDTSAQAILDSMDEEHGHIDPILVRGREALAAMATGRDAMDRPSLVAIFDEALACLSAHLSHEERDANVILQARITREEWDHLERTELRGGMSARELLAMLPWLEKDLPPRFKAEILAEAPLPLRAMLKLGRRAFRKMDDAAFAAVPSGVPVGADQF